VRRVNQERDIAMLRFIQTTPTNDASLPRTLGVLFGTAALVALVSAMPVAPAIAQTGTAPAGLSRLDPPQPSNDGARFTAEQRTKIRGAYARSNRKVQANQ
jgi:hypothetical protein